MENKQTAEEDIKLISGRIIDEHRKHSPYTDEWPLITAKKIHSQWFYYYNQQTKELQRQVEILKLTIYNMNQLMPQSEYTKLKEAADEMACELEDVDFSSLALHKYKHLTNKP